MPSILSLPLIQGAQNGFLRLKFVLVPQIISSPSVVSTELGPVSSLTVAITEPSQVEGVLHDLNAHGLSANFEFFQDGEDGSVPFCSLLVSRFGYNQALPDSIQVLSTSPVSDAVFRLMPEYSSTRLLRQSYPIYRTSSISEVFARLTRPYQVNNATISERIFARLDSRLAVPRGYYGESSRDVSFDLEMGRASFSTQSIEGQPILRSHPIWSDSFMIAVQGGVALVTITFTSTTSLSLNVRILMKISGLCMAIGFVIGCLCSATQHSDRSTPGSRFAERILTGVGRIATAYGFLALMGTLLPDNLMLETTGVVFTAVFPSLVSAIMN
ncbi:hypothetical protein Pint_25933 [Pistacia integerrima]|uniref:Uncharacterized protein n=1 Tax=Pistacia integerrima TaxID=434235 RepID=A0ACC0YCU8_9ROSI|nr:hypothetical protein Pint_25933 [Pistacia integerrima]